jgi:hypothetical protein
MLNHLVRRVRMDFKIGRQRSHRRKRLTGLQFSADEGFRRGKDNLIEDGLPRQKLEAQHCHIGNVTLVTWFVKYAVKRLSLLSCCVLPRLVEYCCACTTASL